MVNLFSSGAPHIRRLFSELELALEVKSTTIASWLADQITSRTGEECEELCLRSGLNCYREDVKRNRGKSGITDSKLLLH